MYDDIDDNDEPDNSLSMSFLDVISCGMLSAVFLALVFSIIGQKPPVLLQTHDFIQITFQVPEGDHRIWNVALTPPGSEEYVIPLEECKLDSSGLLEQGESLESKELARYGIRLLGFHRRFYKTVQENTLRNNSSVTSVTPNTNEFTTRMIIISAPTHGTWSARVFVRDDGEGIATQKPPGIDFAVTLSNNKSVHIPPDDAAQHQYTWQY